MSSFNDATFRSQQMLAPYQMQGAMNKTQGIQNIGAAVQGAVQQNADMYIRMTESSAKVAAFEQEQQLNAYKMQQMLALDQAMMSRHGVSVAESQADMAKLGVEEARAKNEHLRSEAGFNTARQRSVLGEAMMGEPDMILGEDGIPRKGTPDERKKFEDAYRGKQDADRRGSTSDPSLTRYTQLNLQLERAKKRRSDILLDEDGRAAVDAEIARLQPLVDDAFRGIGGDAGGVPARSQPSTQTQAAPTSGPQQTPFERAYSNPKLKPVMESAYSAPEWEQSPTWSKFDDQSKQMISAGVALLGDRIMVGDRNLDPSMRARYVMHFAETRPATMAMLLAMSGRDDEEIRMMLEQMFPERSPKNLDADFQMYQDDVKRMLGGRR